MAPDLENQESGYGPRYLILESLTPSVNAPLSLLNAILLQFYPVIL
jgi:hypothetical protein